MLGGALLLALLSGCAGIVLGKPAPIATLRFQGPEDAECRLYASPRAPGDMPLAVFRLGRESVHRVRSGNYSLVAARTAGDGRLESVALPAPCPAAANALDVTVNVAFPPALPGPEWRWIPPGPTLIGDTLGIGQEDERPAHVRPVGEFFLAACETTNQEFAGFLNAKRGAVDESWAAFDSLKFRLRRDPASGSFVTDAPRLPVVTVSLAGAEAYCAWRTHETGIRHRLPTEVEWERAARGPDSLVYDYGDTYRRDAANQESGTLKEVGGYAPNGWGLHDMTGNAFEWTGDRYRRAAWEEYLAARDSSSPQDDSAGAPEFQVLRGGSFVLDGMYLRSSFRMRQRPDVRTDDIGFRVLREVKR